MEHMSEAIAPGQGEKLLDIICSGRKTENEVQKDSGPQIETSVMQLYESASDSFVRTQLLSTIANKYTKEYLCNAYPCLTKFAIDKARRYIAVGDTDNSKQVEHRHNMNLIQMEHALDFFCNPSFHQVVSFGSKTLKLESGETIDIPSIVRTTLHTNLIKMYTQYCKETDFEPLCNATLYKILNTCSASKQKSLRGLDNTAADGVSGFESLEYIVKLLEKTSEWKESIKQRIRSSKLYFKTQFKLNVSLQSECADHCIKWSLSGIHKGGCFQEVCPHEHKLVCTHCQLFKTTTKDIMEAIQVMETRKDEILKDFEIAVSQVVAWKAHIMRTIAQDNCRLEQLNNLKEDQVLIVMDWAMKYLPLFFREKQSEWYGQKGKHWHVSVVIHKDVDGNFKHRTYTHIIDQVKQDHFVVASIVENVLSTVKTQLPEVEVAYLRSDNAGCYKSGQLWCMLPHISQRTGIFFRRYDYSEPQSGKSYCDAKIAHMRLKMRLYVAANNNIQTASDMKAAIDSNGGVVGCHVAVIDIDANKPTVTHRFQGISFITNIEFSENGDIKAWRAYNIGSGEVIPVSKYSSRNTGICIETGLSIIEDFNAPKLEEGTINVEKKLKQPSEQNAEESTENDVRLDNANVETCADHDQESGLFPCPEFGCRKVYVSHVSLENHIYFGQHDLKKERESSYDIIRKKWADVCTNMTKNMSIAERDSSSLTASGECCDIEEMGWALKQDRKRVKFSENVKSFLRELFEIGERTGKKLTLLMCQGT